MAITAPVAGAYTGTWNSLALLYTRRGFNLHFTQRGERVEESDLYGRSLIDIIYTGAQVSIDTTCMVYTANIKTVFWPWTGTFGVVYNTTNPIAQLASTAGKSLVLTTVANTPAAAGAGPNTVTANPSIISPDNDQTLVLNSQLREVPLRFDCLTTDSTGTGSVIALT